MRTGKVSLAWRWFADTAASRQRRPSAEPFLLLTSLCLLSTACSPVKDGATSPSPVTSSKPHPSEPAPGSADAIIQTARQRSAGEAITLLENAWQHNPNEPKIAEELSRRLLSTGQVSEAYRVVSTFNHAHQADELAAEGFRILGNFYATVRSQVEALKALDKAVTLAPNSGLAWRDLAMAREYFPNAASTGKALEAAEKAVSLLPNDATAWLTLARLQKRVSSPDARTSYQRAAAAAPDRADVHRQFGEWLMQYGKEDSDRQLALQEAETSLKIDPQSPLSLLLIGQARLVTKNAAAAIDPLTEAARLSPNTPRPASLLAQAYQAIGNRTEFRHWRTETERRAAYQNQLHTLFAELTTRPGDRKLMAKMATLLGNHGEISEAVRYKAMSLNEPPDSPAVFKAVAKDLQTGGYNAAADALNKRATERSSANLR